MSDDAKPKKTLKELLEDARKHVITPEEYEAQRQSWMRGEMALGEYERSITRIFDAPMSETAEQRQAATDYVDAQLNTMRKYGSLRPDFNENDRLQLIEKVLSLIPRRPRL